jgi:hypothetical protein
VPLVAQPAEDALRLTHVSTVQRLALGVLSMSLVACGGASSPAASGRALRLVPSKATSPISPTFPFTDKAAIQGGDHHPERFCAVAPAEGSVRYETEGKSARLVVRLRDIQTHGLVGLVWAPGSGHAGEEIASVSVQKGVTVQRSLRFFHAPFYNRLGRALELITNSQRIVAGTRPC